MVDIDAAEIAKMRTTIHVPVVGDAGEFIDAMLSQIPAGETYRRECFQSGIDYVPLDTSMPFDRALTEYLLMRQSRG